jgi:hypothetical protein
MRRSGAGFFPRVKFDDHPKARHSSQKFPTSIWAQTPLLLHLPAGTKVKLGCDDFRGVRSYRMRVGQKPFNALVEEINPILLIRDRSD